MDTDVTRDQDWKTLLSFLPGNLDEVARATGALRRRREVQSGEALLRLALVYGDPGLSLRETSAWARSNGIARLSDVALLKRLRGACGFLRALGSFLLSPPEAPGLHLRLKALDATCLARRRSGGTDFRVHLTYDLSQGRVSGIEFTDARGGERLDRASSGPGDLVVADRGHPGRGPLHAVVSRGAKVIVRFHPTSLPMSVEGTRIAPLELARSLEIGEILDLPVRTLPKGEVPAVPGRLVVLRKTEELARRDLRRLKRRAKEDGRPVGKEASSAARCVFAFTTLSPEQADGRTVMDIYRLRWQIEMLFKRAKGVVSLGETAARDMGLAEAMVLSQLVALLLIERCREAFSPWGYPVRGRKPLSVVQGPVPAG